MQSATVDLVQRGTLPKGNAFETARLAGIMAAKRTAELIPFCHPICLTHVEVSFNVPRARDRLEIVASAKAAAPTGVEMEALTAVLMAALTIYDMCKSVDKTMTIEGVRLLEKTKTARNSCK